MEAEKARPATTFTTERFSFSRGACPPCARYGRSEVTRVGRKARKVSSRHAKIGLGCVSIIHKDYGNLILGLVLVESHVPGSADMTPDHVEVEE